MKIPGFISYSHADGKILTQGLAKYLKNLFPNFEPVYDEDVNEGEKLEKIKQELFLCNILFVIITPAALHSKKVAEEIRISKEKGMKIIPCKDQYVGKSWDELPWKLNDYKGIEFENIDELKRKAYSILVKTLEKLVEELQKSIPKKSETKPSELTEQDNQSIGEVKGETSWRKFTLKTRKKDHGIMATIVNGKIEDILLDRKSLSLIYKIKADSDGFLKTIIRRDLIDSKKNGKDDKFIVLVNGDEVTYDELPTSIKQRALQIKFPKDAIEIEIIGSEREGLSYAGEAKEENEVKILPDSSVPSAERFLEPETLEIISGEKVRWINNDTAAHTITSGTPSEGPDHLFDSSLFMSKTTFEVTFHEKGTYTYFDMVHPWIKGKIIVK